jgi:polysaccharide export outer membrane protein
MKCGAKRWLVLWCAVVVSGWCLKGSAQTGSQADHDRSVAAAAPKDDVGVKAHDNSFVIGNDDVLSINVWKEPELTKSVPVRSDGRISLPLVGEMQASGRTPRQLELDIAEKLKSYINTPEVTVMVEKVNSKKFNILGEVTKPGSYSLEAASTVVDAIAVAGGFRDFAKKNGIYILRNSPNGAQIRIPFNYKEFIKGKNPSQNVKLEPNDSVIVP